MLNDHTQNFSKSENRSILNDQTQDFSKSRDDVTISPPPRGAQNIRTSLLHRVSSRKFSRSPHDVAIRARNFSKSLFYRDLSQKFSHQKFLQVPKLGQGHPDVDAKFSEELS